MAHKTGFAEMFAAATGNPPFPWQEELYEKWFSQGKIPSSCDIPTGLGKTSVVAIWLIALANRPDKMPRRLVYVVNRRTVVDQTTDEVAKLRRNLEDHPDLQPLRDQIGSLAVSTLRGQFADNQEWSADPSRPAVICGTVDMIGSRLLFEGYRIGFKSRPLHAGFLGQDALLVHDEAHLEPAFQKLIESIQCEQKQERDRNGELPWTGLRIMALSATGRGDGKNARTQDRDPFELTNGEKQPPDVIPDPPTEPIHHVWRRLKAKKSLRLHSIADEKKLAGEVAALALKHEGSNAAVLVFVRTVDDVNRVCDRLKKSGVQDDNLRQLTGTMRGYERDKLVENATFQRFLNPSQDAEGTVYLVCTSAGEVGVNLSADHMVCDLSTFDSMAQRLGRVNRFGDRDDSQIDVVFPESFDERHALTPARMATLALLQELDDDASPKALAELPEKQRLEAFAPEPTILAATDILFDAWSMTTIKGNMPGRPRVGPYLHGVADWEPPRTSVAWREEVERITDELIEREGEDLPQELLGDYPLKPHELLSDRTDRVYAALEELIAQPMKSVKGEKRNVALEKARRNAASNVWLIDENSSVQVTTFGELLKDDKKRVIDRLADSIVLLPPSVGGLSGGMLNADSDHADDVADHWLHEHGNPRRGRVWDEDPPPTYEHNGKTKPMALIRTIDTDPLAEELAPPEEEAEASSSRKRFWHWYARPRDAEEATCASARPIKWDHHTRDVVNRATEIIEGLNLPKELKQIVVLAAELHDLGKRRELWQRSIGNPNPSEWYAKPGKPVDGKPWRPRYLSDYRHEFGSLLDVLDESQEHAAEFARLSDEMRDVVLHLIAAHHGRARPHFTTTEIIDPASSGVNSETVSVEVMRRYARLQRRYGRWGLAYLESLLRAADWAASADPSESEGGA